MPSSKCEKAITRASAQSQVQSTAPYSAAMTVGNQASSTLAIRYVNNADWMEDAKTSMTGSSMQGEASAGAHVPKPHVLPSERLKVGNIVSATVISDATEGEPRELGQEPMVRTVLKGSVTLLNTQDQGFPLPPLSDNDESLIPNMDGFGDGSLYWGEASFKPPGGQKAELINDGVQKGQQLVFPIPEESEKKQEKDSEGRSTRVRSETTDTEKSSTSGGL